jgi:hypothetical protein
MTSRSGECPLHRGLRHGPFPQWRPLRSQSRSRRRAIDCRSAARWLLVRLRAGNKAIARPIATAAACSGSSRRLTAAYLRADVTKGLQRPAEMRLTVFARQGTSCPSVTLVLLPVAARCRRSPCLVPGAPRARMGEPGRGPAAPRSSARNGGLSLFSLPRRPAQRAGTRRRHSARKTKKRPAVLRSAPALRQGARVRSDRPRPVDRHRGRSRRGPTRNRRRTWRPSAASRSPRTATMPVR